MSPAEKVRETVDRWPNSTRYIAVMATIGVLLQLAELFR